MRGCDANPLSVLIAIYVPNLQHLVVGVKPKRTRQWVQLVVADVDAWIQGIKVP